MIATGHQAEFFHAGVFAKTVAVDALAGGTNATGVFLTVDSDTAKSDVLSVPVREDGHIKRGSEPIPGTSARLPTEAFVRQPASAWNAFFEAVGTGTLAGQDSELNTFRNGFLTQPPRQIDFVTGIEQGQTSVERALGLQPCKTIRISALSETPEFRQFVMHLATRAHETASAYNAAIARYRQRNRVKTIGRPVPELLIDGGRVESPFWLLGPDQRRYRMFVSGPAREVTVWADKERIGSLAGEADAAIGCLQRAGWRVRPRALTLSGFARLALSDLFIHGIGGAKYDEVTDDFMRAIFGDVLAPLACVTATLRLIEQSPRNDSADWRRAQWRLRDVRHNPQRQIEGLPAALLAERSALVEEVLRLRRESPRQHSQRRMVHRALREKNAEILAARPGVEKHLADEAEKFRAAWEESQASDDREYFFALHSRGALAALVNGIRDSVT